MSSQLNKCTVKCGYCIHVLKTNTFKKGRKEISKYRGLTYTMLSRLICIRFWKGYLITYIPWASLKREWRISAIFNKSRGTIIPQTINRRSKKKTAIAKKREIRSRNPVKKSYTNWAQRLVLSFLEVSMYACIHGHLTLVSYFRWPNGRNRLPWWLRW